LFYIGVNFGLIEGGTGIDDAQKEYRGDNFG
jgi:hypothetical protein